MTRREDVLPRWSFLWRTSRDRKRKRSATDADLAFTLATDGRSSGGRRARVDDRVSAGRVFKLRCCLRVAHCICKNIAIDQSVELRHERNEKDAIKIHQFTLEGGCTWKKNNITLVYASKDYKHKEDRLVLTQHLGLVGRWRPTERAVPTNSFPDCRATNPVGSNL